MARNSSFAHITLCTFLLLLTFVSCQRLANRDSLPDDDLLSTEADILAGGPAVSIDTMRFSDDGSRISIQATRHRNFDQYFFGDTTSVRFEVLEYIDPMGWRIPSRHPSRISSVHVCDSKDIDSLGLQITCILDLTLDYPLVELQRHALKDINGMFRPDRLQLRFITDEGLSDPYSCTDYIINTHVVPTGTGYKQLYRHLLTALNSLRGQCDAIILMSDGKVYDEDLAMDDDHYALQEALYNMTAHSDRVSTYPPLYYYNLNPAPIGGTADATTLTHESESIIQLLCDYTGGFVTYDFEGYSIMKSILRRHGIDFAAINLTLANPDGKVYIGPSHTLALEIRDARNDSLLASVSHEFAMGSIAHPVIIAPRPLQVTLLRGAFTTIFILLALYLGIQFLLPWLRFRYFKFRYMGRYHGFNTFIGGHIVEDTCYYCKGRIALGDEIVAACKHTMHRECWQANEYRCPEHGHDPQCRHSHHYYNAANILDTRNGHYSLEWLVWATMAGFVIWVLHIFSPEWSDTVFAPFLLTVLFSLLTLQHSHRYHMVIYLLAMGAAASLMTWACHSLIVAAGIWDTHHLLTAALFVLNTLTVAICVVICSTWHTIHPLRMRRFGIGITILALIEFVFCLVLFYTEMEIYGALLLNGIVVAYILCGIVCRPRRKSFHYFLHLEGCTKPIDVALYKWFNANPQAVVNIGHSVDCQLQLVWDIQCHIAPVAASIVCRGGAHYLQPVEDGVYSAKGRPIAPGHSVRLYHGYRFNIGNCNFTYVEKDLK